MIPAASTNFADVTGALASFSYGISQSKSAQTMLGHVLRNSLYTRKLLAILREVTWNALDIHAMSGKADVKVLVTLPTRSDPTLVIRDFGTGLSVQDVRDYLLTLGNSMKREVDDVNGVEVVGFMGIGAKAPHCYVDSFTVISYHGGFKRTFVSVLGQDNEGQAHLMDESPSDELGIEYRISVLPSDIDVCNREARHVFRFVTDRVELVGGLTGPPKFSWTGSAGGLIKQDGNVQWEVVAGGIPYRLDMKNIPNIPDHFRSSVGGVIFLDANKVDVAASREDVAYTVKTQKAIVDALDSIFTEFGQQALLGVLLNDELSHWDKRLRIEPLVELMPAIRKLPDVADLLRNAIFVDKAKYPFLRFYRSEESRRDTMVLKETDTPTINRDTKILVLADHRDYQPHLRIDDDIITVTAIGVKSTDDLDADEYDLDTDVERFLEDHRLTGIKLLDDSYLAEVSAKVGKPYTAKRRFVGNVFEAELSRHDLNVSLPSSKSRWNRIDSLKTEDCVIALPIRRWSYSNTKLANRALTVAKELGLNIRVFGIIAKNYDTITKKNPNFFKIEDLVDRLISHYVDDNPEELERIARHVGADHQLMSYSGSVKVHYQGKVQDIPENHPINDWVYIPRAKPFLYAEEVANLVFREYNRWGSNGDHYTSDRPHPSVVFAQAYASFMHKYPLTFMIGNGTKDKLTTSELINVMDYVDMIDAKENK